MQSLPLRAECNGLNVCTGNNVNNDNYSHISRRAGNTDKAVVNPP